VNGAKFQAVLEDLGFLVFIDTHSNRGRFVRFADGTPYAFYSMNEDGAFRHGWVKHDRGHGRSDFTDWPNFYDRITRRKAAGATL